MRLGRPTDTVRFDLKNRPCSRVERGAASAALFLVPIGAVFAGIPIAAVWEWGVRDSLGPGGLFFLPFFLLGAGSIGLGVAQLTARREVEIGVDEVRCRKRLFVRERTWTEPLSSYRGVRRRREETRARAREGRLVLYCVDLVHPDRTRNVELHRARSKAMWRERAGEAAGALGVPLLERPMADGG